MVVILSWGYTQPTKHLFLCEGTVNVSKLVKEPGDKTTSKFYESGQFLKVYEYLWGIDYSLDHFDKTDCGVDGGESVVCSSGTEGSPEYRYADFNLDTGKYFYRWTSDGPKDMNTYRENMTCKKTSRAIERSNP